MQGCPPTATTNPPSASVGRGTDSDSCPVDAASVAAWLSLAACPDARAHWWGARGSDFDPRARVELLRHAGISLPAPNDRRLARCLAWLEQPGNALVGWDAAAYPETLASLEDPPPVLFVSGDRSLLAALQVAIVGSRRPSPGGAEHAYRLARDLAQAGLVITSGLARGIDAAAHRGALAAGGAGPTVGVSGCGPDVVYPREHAELYAEVAACGLLVSEFPPGTTARPHHFPRRNRLISGLARAVVVVEAAQPSGSLITARLALGQGREVLAVPGSVTNPEARGCHALIRDGARLVEDASQVLEELSSLPLQLPVPRQRRPLATRPAGAGAGAGDGRGGHVAPPRPPPDAGPTRAVPAELPASLSSPSVRRVLAAMGTDLVDIDSVVFRSGLTVSDVSSILAALELSGLVWVGPAGTFQRKPD
ncbi:MAG TPA: DNA-protecting protein DprA [Gammaproteobacteria bacterium]|nr:DNA-protecting protein DprA [Gammaproteobacteria bacterium]